MCTNGKTRTTLTRTRWCVGHTWSSLACCGICSAFRWYIWIQNTRALAHSHAHPHAPACLTLCFLSPAVFVRHGDADTSFRLNDLCFFCESSSRWASPSQGERWHVSCALTESCVSFPRQMRLVRCRPKNGPLRCARARFFLRKCQPSNSDVKQHTVDGGSAKV